MDCDVIVIGGGLVGALLLALWLTPRSYGRAYLCGAVCYLITVLIFALAQRPARARHCC